MVCVCNINDNRTAHNFNIGSVLNEAPLPELFTTNVTYSAANIIFLMQNHKFFLSKWQKKDLNLLYIQQMGLIHIRLGRTNKLSLAFNKMERIASGVLNIN